MKLAIPEGTLVNHIAVLGKAGSGKSSAICTVITWLLEKQKRVCIIDPTGVWWGLRLKADGKTRGFNVVIFGGRHADLPLDASQGAMLADVVGTTSTPVIIDTSLMSVKQRTIFFSELGEALLRRNSGPLHLVIDEAHLFAPQGKVSDPQSGQMLHATNNLISLGRARGLRVAMITQRPAKLHKDSLTQAETLIAMRLIAPQDRAAVKDWMGEWADNETNGANGHDILMSLPSMKTGQGWVWAPALNYLDKTAFPRIETLDSFATPEDGDGDGRALPPIDIDHVSDQMKQAAQVAKDNDPKTLKAKIADLTRDLDIVRGRSVSASPEELQAEYRRGFAEGWAERAIPIIGFGQTLEKELKRIIDLTAPDAGSKQSARITAPSAPRRDARAAERPAPSTDTGGLGKGEAACLSAIINLNHGRGITRETLTVVTGYKKTSRNTYLQRLMSKGFIENDDDKIVATEMGIVALPDIPRLPTGQALRAHYLGRLPQGEALVFGHVVKVYPNSVSRDILSDWTGYKKTSLNTYIQRLSSRLLVVTDRDGVKASRDLF
jgi:hypothetical protein